MNYLLEIKCFHDRIAVESYTTGEIALWHALMGVDNQLGWPVQFPAPTGLLCQLTGLKPNRLYEAREKLVERKRIIVLHSTQKSEVLYQMIPLKRSRTNPAIPAFFEDERENGGKIPGVEREIDGK